MIVPSVPRHIVVISRLFLPYEISLAEKVICAACQMGKAHLKALGKRKIVKKDSIKEPGDLFHMDQAESTTAGRPFTHSGKNSTKKIYVVSLFVDSVSKKVFVEFQRSTGAKETVKSKHNIERQSRDAGVKIKSFRADNGIFKAAEFKTDLEMNDQSISFCGVGAHHQNGVAERFIRTFIERARTVLLNAHARWPGKLDMELWT